MGSLGKRQAEPATPLQDGRYQHRRTPHRNNWVDTLVALGYNQWAEYQQAQVRELEEVIAFANLERELGA